MDDPSATWTFTGSDHDLDHDSLPFPAGGVHAIRTRLADHEKIESEVLASLDNLKAGLDDIAAILEQAIPFRMPDDDRPTAA